MATTDDGVGDMSPLLALLNAPGRDVVVEVLEMAFRSRKGRPTSDEQAHVAEQLEIPRDQVPKILQAAQHLVAIGLRESLSTDGIANLFPSTFHEKLRALLAQVIASKLPEWRETAMASQPSLPRLLDVDWRVDVKAASSFMSRMSVPSALVQLSVHENASHVGEVPGVRRVTFELNRETLQAMLDGLSKIREQLSSIQQQSQGS